MTARQERFVAEYLKDGNGLRAAIRAGYSRKGAEVTASKLLRVPKVAEALAKVRAEVLDESKVTLEGHLNKLAEIRDRALRLQQTGPAVSAETARGKVAGLYVERSLVETRQLPQLVVE